MPPDPTLIPLGFFVGMLVGLTGVGGGAVLTPLLVLVAGVRPSVAIGTDLAFAAVTKVVGGWQHWRAGQCDPCLVLRLSGGSVPGALLGAQAITVVQAAGLDGAEEILSHTLGVALIVAAAVSVLRASGASWSLGRAGATPGWAASVAMGFGVGVLVGLTSVGAGSVLMAAFALLYSLPAVKMVGTDVVHGALLATAAATAHAWAGRVDALMLAALLIGSLPGVLLGSWLCGRLPARPLRLAVATVLMASGLRLI
ncbi:MAG: sulfite exporter TauE/SafE family protein [Chloroflexi bacterium]|nr:sulfite exporter TauE/SafE family protein [Chloroflexota bacterium]